MTGARPLAVGTLANFQALEAYGIGEQVPHQKPGYDELTQFAVTKVVKAIMVRPFGKLRYDKERARRQ